jgi:hypothetical protein
VFKDAQRCKVHVNDSPVRLVPARPAALIALGPRPSTTADSRCDTPKSASTNWTSMPCTTSEETQWVNTLPTYSPPSSSIKAYHMPPLEGARAAVSKKMQRPPQSQGMTSTPGSLTLYPHKHCVTCNGSSDTSSTLAARRSRCRMPKECRCRTPAAICCMAAMTKPSGTPPCTRRVQTGQQKIGSFAT